MFAGTGGEVGIIILLLMKNQFVAVGVNILAAMGNEFTQAM